MTGALAASLLAATKSSGSSGVTLILFLVVIAGVGYFLLIRPQKQKARRQQEQQSSIGVGDFIQTVGGIVGRVEAIDASHVTIVSGADTVGFAAVGTTPTRLVLVRNAIARKVEPTVADSADGHGDDYAEDGSHEDGYNEDGYGDGRTAEGGGTSP